jgi:hypothetical protein
MSIICPKGSRDIKISSNIRIVGIINIPKASKIAHNIKSIAIEVAALLDSRNSKRWF